jgi:protocatechuate 3,4-dioxygenase, beta subunit
MPSHLTRLIAAACLAATVSVETCLAAPPVRTAEVTEGPFYPFNKTNTLPAISDRDNDLTRVAGGPGSAKGLPFILSGVVRDLNGAPVSDAKVELWQTDDGGVYYHSGDNNAAKRDANFQFYGESVTGKDGRYSFRTVKPGLYTGRIRHFHFKVKRGDATVLISQFTFDDERSTFQTDGVQRRLSGDALESTVIAPKRGTDAAGKEAWLASKDIVIDPNGKSSTEWNPNTPPSAAQAGKKK